MSESALGQRRALREDADPHIALRLENAWQLVEHGPHRGVVGSRPRVWQGKSIVHAPDETWDGRRRRPDEVAERGGRSEPPSHATRPSFRSDHSGDGVVAIDEEKKCALAGLRDAMLGVRRNDQGGALSASRGAILEGERATEREADLHCVVRVKLGR
ncbi:MAG: hypothetical protein JWO86_670 [Myxococcaceae bacterium]|nr:hypothetical protein [Myxococcaceae bacterium]